MDQPFRIVRAQIFASATRTDLACLYEGSVTFAENALSSNTARFSGNWIDRCMLLLALYHPLAGS